MSSKRTQRHSEDIQERYIDCRLGTMKVRVCEALRSGVGRPPKGKSPLCKDCKQYATHSLATTHDGSTAESAAYKDLATRGKVRTDASWKSDRETLGRNCGIKIW